MIELSQNELQRVKVIENAVQGRITVGEASGLLELSTRQVKRLKGRYQADQVDWVRHRNRGRPRPWAISEAVKKRIVELARNKYAGFVRRLLRRAKLRSPQRRRARKYRARRERKPRLGMMVLTDASREDWLEGRGPALTLIGYQDDATGQVLASAFQLEHEDTLGYLRQLRAVVERQGVPLSLYRDQHGTFQRNDKHWTLEEQIAGRQTPTQLGRVLEELGIQSIRALSPQAKGRIERLWKTFQDRLKSELRLAGAATLEQANQVLETFREDYNQRFAVAARETANDFRPLSKKLNWDRLFSLRYERVVGKDHVVDFGARSIQLPARKDGQGYAGVRVELSHQLNGELHVWHGQQDLFSMQLPLDYAPGLAPRRPAERKKKQPRIYSFSGREALAVR
ncbi:MAG: ISNCY family transposase [Bryobacteraceae bacterium]